MYGRHLLNSWSTTQNVVELSFGEAEYYGLVKGGAQSIGFKKMMEELGIKIGVKLKTDASAAKGIATRRGMGNVRHIEVSQHARPAEGRPDIKVIKTMCWPILI